MVGIDGDGVSPGLKASQQRPDAAEMLTGIAGDNEENPWMTDG